MVHVPLLSRRALVIRAAASAFTALLTACGGGPAPSGAPIAAPTFVPLAATVPPPATDAAAADRTFQMLGDTIRAAMQRYRVPGVAVGVLSAGTERTAGFGVTNLERPQPVDADTLFQIGSITKVCTATAIMRLVEVGKLDLKAPVRAYLPDLMLADADVAAHVTLKHLLTHTGGWHGDFIKDTGDGDDALAKYVALEATLPQVAPLGRFFSYSNAGFNLAGRVIEVVTGKPYEAAMQELVLDPLGMHYSFYFPAEAMRHPYASGYRDGKVVMPWSLPRSHDPDGGLTSTVKEQLTFARFHLGDGTGAGGGRIITRATLDLMQQRLGPGGTLGYDELDGIGAAWELRTPNGVSLVTKGGDTAGQQSFLVLVPSRGFALIILTNAAAGARLHHEVSRWALDHYLGLTEPDTPTTPLTAEQAAAWAGRYRVPGYTNLELRPSNGTLLLQYLSGPFKNDSPSQLVPYGPDRVIEVGSTSAGIRGSFVRKPDGTVGWFRWVGRLSTRI